MKRRSGPVGRHGQGNKRRKRRPVPETAVDPQGRAPWRRPGATLDAGRRHGNCATGGSR